MIKFETKHALKIYKNKYLFPPETLEVLQVIKTTDFIPTLLRQPHIVGVWLIIFQTDSSGQEEHKLL